jgi:hypothetical protein
MNEEDIYISLAVEEVTDYEHEYPRATFKALYVQDEVVKEDEVICGELIELIPYLQIF